MQADACMSSYTALPFGHSVFNCSSRKVQNIAGRKMAGPFWELVPDSICTRNREAPHGPSIRIPPNVCELELGRGVKGEGHLPLWPQVSTYHCRIWMSPQVGVHPHRELLLLVALLASGNCPIGPLTKFACTGATPVVSGGQEYEWYMYQCYARAEGLLQTPAGG